MSLLSFFAWAAWIAGGTPADASLGSYVWIERPDAAGTAHAGFEPYDPREGDIVLYDDHNAMWQVLYKMAGSGMPDHSGIVVSLPDGEMALLESAPDDGNARWQWRHAVSTGRGSPRRSTCCTRSMDCRLSSRRGLGSFGHPSGRR